MKRSRKILRWIGIVLLIAGALACTLYLVYIRPFIQKMKVVTSISYDKELTLVTGGGGNSGILVSDSLVVVIDTKMDEAALDLHRQVKSMAGTKPVLVINTHYHPDHCAGNKLYKGAEILAGSNYGEEAWVKEAGRESLPNHWLKNRLDIRMNDDTMTILNFAQNAHTESDVFVYLHKRKLLFGGDVILNRQNPIILGKGDPDGYLRAFEFLRKNFDIRHVVPGHGDVGGIEVIDRYDTYFKDMKQAAADNAQKDALVSKYKDWTAIPVFMSPGATIKAFRKKIK